VQWLFMRLRMWRHHCAGFWAKHQDEFAAGQIAQRFGLVEEVDDDF
jgi:hypothetical protein